MSELSLKVQHLVINRSLVERVLMGETHVLVKYHTEDRVLLVSPGSNNEFKTSHKAALHMLKDKNLKGDKSVAIHEILIDQELDEGDRELFFSEEAGIIKITL